MMADEPLAIGPAPDPEEVQYPASRAPNDPPADLTPGLLGGIPGDQQGLAGHVDQDGLADEVDDGGAASDADQSGRVGGGEQAYGSAGEGGAASALASSARAATPSQSASGLPVDEERRGGQPPAAPGNARGEARAARARHVPGPARAGQPERITPLRLAEPRTLPAGTPDAKIKIGLWGAPGSGKTAFLAALRLASAMNDGWTLYPRDTKSTESMVSFTKQLVDEHRFPEPSPYAAFTELSWLLLKNDAGRRAWRALFPGLFPSGSFDLELIDASGEVFADSPKSEVPRHVIDQTLDHLVGAQGLLYLFDPIAEREGRDSSGYTNRTISELSQRMLSEGRLAGSRLPHHVSVCITKFDDPEVFQQAMRLNLVDMGPDGLPRISGANAREFFDRICDGSFWRSHDGHDERHNPSAEFIRRELKNRFRHKRIHYYACSAVGFMRSPDGFDPDNFANVATIGGEDQILGPVNPVNILEPLTDMYRLLRRRAWFGA